MNKTQTFRRDTLNQLQMALDEFFIKYDVEVVSCNIVCTGISWQCLLIYR